MRCESYPLLTTRVSSLGFLGSKIAEKAAKYLGKDGRYEYVSLLSLEEPCLILQKKGW